MSFKTNTHLKMMIAIFSNAFYSQQKTLFCWELEKLDFDYQHKKIILLSWLKTHIELENYSLQNGFSLLVFKSYYI